MLKLPRTEIAAEALIRLETYLKADVRPLFEGLKESASYLAFDECFTSSLKATVRTGCLTQGLETIAKDLEAEKKGLLEVQQKKQQPVAHRMSRLLLVSNDGSERFYRQVGSLLQKHAERLWCCRVEASSETLGDLLQTNPAKAVLIREKKALSLFLTELSRKMAGKSGGSGRCPD